MNQKVLTVLIFISCLLSGYFFYKFNSGDWFSGIFFATGLLGIGFSFLRNRDN